MGSHKTDVFVIYTTEFYVLCKYWPDDGLLRPKLVANNNNDNNNNNNKHMIVSDGVNILFYFIKVL